jgi:hypothetical protein
MLGSTAIPSTEKICPRNGTSFSHKAHLLNLAELMVPKSLQNNLEMPHMLFFIFGVDQDVINEDHNKLVQLRHEFGVHQVYEMCRSIGESKRHKKILIQPVPSGEGSLRNVFRADLDLMIARMEIDLGKDFGTGRLIKKEC